MYAGRLACCPLLSHGEYLPSALKKGGTDKHTDDVPLYYACRYTRKNFVLQNVMETFPRACYLFIRLYISEKTIRF